MNFLEWNLPLTQPDADDGQIPLRNYANDLARLAKSLNHDRVVGCELQPPVA